MLSFIKRRVNPLPGIFQITKLCFIRSRKMYSLVSRSLAAYPATKILLKKFFIGFFIFATLLTILMCFALDDTPQAVVYQGLNRDDIERAKQLLHVEPADRDSLRTIRLNQKDLNIAVSYLLTHFVENTSLIQILPERIWFQIAIFMPKNPWGRYLDLHFSLIQRGDQILMKSFKIGEISVPDPAANVLIPFIVHNTSLNQYWLAAKEYIKDIRITPETLEVSYLGSIVDTAKRLASNQHKDYPNLHLYQQQINEIVNQHDPNWRLSLSELLQPLFEAAYQRSTDDTAIRENRTVIIAVASYVYKNELRHFLPLGLIYNKEFLVYAHKRIDVPQHFIASALFSAVDSSLLSQLLGVEKEVGDSQHGSGFSFIDLSADRAGMRFGQLAIASKKLARKLQENMSRIRDYSAFLPDIQGLPENMDEQAFKEKFVNVESNSYKEMIRVIDKRISDLPLYQIE